MESLGKVGSDKQLYQCSFCFKRIVVKPFGIAKGTFESKVTPPSVQQVQEEQFMRGQKQLNQKAVGAKR